MNSFKSVRAFQIELLVFEERGKRLKNQIISALPTAGH